MDNTFLIDLFLGLSTQESPLVDNDQLPSAHFHAELLDEATDKISDEELRCEVNHAGHRYAGELERLGFIEGFRTAAKIFKGV